MMASLIIVSPPSLKRHLPVVGLVIIVLTRASVVSTASCHKSNCQFNVKDECQGSVSVDCNLEKQTTKKINITKTSFPKHVKTIYISNVEEMWIEADAIASLASLATIELENIDNLTLLHRSLARTSESRPISVTMKDVKSLQLHPETFADWRNSDSTITIRDVDKCHMSQKTIAPRTLILSLKLVHITTLTIDRDAIAADSAIEDMLLTEVKSLTVKTGAFASNTTVKNMHLEDITSLTLHPGAFASNTTVKNMHLEDIASLTLHTGAFAQNSSIQNAVVERVTSVLIASGGIQADISKLNISDVFMTTCEDNTFGSTIQAMSFASSHINLTKSGCISASAGWKKLLVENSQFDHIESLAISGTIDEVQIENSSIGTVDTGGFTLNVTRFTVEGSTIGELSKEALTVSAAEVITLKQCDVHILRKHAFSLLQLDGVKDGIIIENLHINQTENESLHFAPRTNVVVSQLELGIPCTCDMMQELGLPSRMHLGHGDDKEASDWLEQTRCVSNTTTPTLAEYDQQYCPDPTTTPAPTTTITSSSSSSGGGGGGGRVLGAGRPTVLTAGPSGSPVTGLTLAGGDNKWVMIGTITAAALILITVVALLVHRQLQRSRSNQQNSPESPTRNSSERDQLNKPDKQATASNAPDNPATAACTAPDNPATADRTAPDNPATADSNTPDSLATADSNTPHSQVTAECGEADPVVSGARPADSGSYPYNDPSHRLHLANQQNGASQRHPRSPQGSLRKSSDRGPESRRHPQSPVGSLRKSSDRDHESARHPRSPEGSLRKSSDRDHESPRHPRSPEGSLRKSSDRDHESPRHPRSPEGSLRKSSDRDHESPRHPRSPEGSLRKSSDRDHESPRRTRSPEGSFGMSYDYDPEYRTGAREAPRPQQSWPADKLYYRGGNTQKGGQPNNQWTTEPGSSMGRCYNPHEQPRLYQTSDGYTVLMKSIA